MKKSFGLYGMILSDAKVYRSDFDLLKGNRKAATNRLLAEVRAVQANPELSDEEKSQWINRLTTVIIALNFGLIACSMFLARCHHCADRRRNLYEKDDYEQRAAEVLCVCVTKYDPGRGSSFANFAIRSITRELYNLRILDLTEFKTGQPGRDARDVLTAARQLGIAGESISYETICERVHRNNPKSTLTVEKIKELSKYLTCADDGDEGEDGNGRPRQSAVEQQPAATEGPVDEVINNEQEALIRERLLKGFSTDEVEMICDKMLNGYRDSEIVEKYHVDLREFKKLWAKARNFMRKDPVLRRFLPD